MKKNWDLRYLKLANEVASWSKDPSRKIGAVAVGDKGQVLAQGYNGFPRGVFDLPDRYEDRPTKYKYVVHAEMNVIYNSCYNGVSLDGATLYITGLPMCAECTKGIIQVGIKRVVMDADLEHPIWKESWKLSQQMLDEAGVQYEFINLKEKENA
jgi:dCMP deaminase